MYILHKTVSKKGRHAFMKAYTSNNIRNIAVLGHGGKGKTTLCEAMLYISGASERLGKVAFSHKTYVTEESVSFKGTPAKSTK